MDIPEPDAAEATLGRRERNKRRVKERIYSCAMELFTEKGYEHTSVDEIAEAADVARGTFFNHYQRKEDLITAWEGRRRKHLLKNWEHLAMPRRDDLRTTLNCLMDILLP
ncbi:helix-turn-helix transcriptional regulator [Streptacidiphilus sp. 4-A2]|nr:helix-turn-helix transcriptional regulator [Streptacidiphilus sp. 4-A2]